MLSGCAGGPGVLNTEGYAPRYEKRNFGEWEPFDTRKTSPRINLKRVRIVPSGQHTARISGVAVCSYNEVELQRQPYEDVIYRDYWNGRKTSRTIITRTELLRVRTKYNYRDGESRRRQEIPSVVSISNPYGPNLDLNVASDGSFSGKLNILYKYFFKELRTAKWYTAYVRADRKMLKISAATKTGESSTWQNLPKITFSDLDDEAIKEFVSDYVNSLHSSVTLEFKEQITRRDVSPKVTITPIGVPSLEKIREAARAHTLRELGEDKDVVALGMKRFNSMVRSYDFRTIQTSQKKYNAQSVNYSAYVGGKYMIETVHGEYHYFKGFLSPKSSSSINKTVLMVEKGEKIRVQSVKEGEGGSMIDE